MNLTARFIEKGVFLREEKEKLLLIKKH